MSREYQAVIAYVVYSQSIKGAQYMNIAGELEKRAGEELDHALAIVPDGVVLVVDQGPGTRD